jgi:DNA primase
MDSITEEIRQRADIVEIVGQYVALRPAGNDRWKACCPFHDEKTPSFYVTREKGFFKCFGCSASGDVFKFVQQIENLTFPEAKRQLAERYGVALPRAGRELSPEQKAAYDERDRLLKIMAAAAAFFREQLAGNKGLDARDYCRKRGLSAKTIDLFGIGYAPDAWDGLYRHLVNKYGFTPEDGARAGLLVEKEKDDGRVRHYDRFRHRLMFPIWDERGRVVAFGGRALEGGTTGNPDAKYLNSPEGPLFTKSHLLYAWHIARAEAGKREAVIINEGYMDAIALHEAGFGNAMATLGTALTTQHVAALRRLSPKIVYLCFDGDSAGMRAALRAAPLFAANQLDVRVVDLPAEHDPDTFVREFGAVGLQNALNQAKLLNHYRVEMAISGFDLGSVTERAEAVRAAAHVISEVDSSTERDGYITWLADRWANAEGVAAPARVQMIQTAVRREVESVGRRDQRRQSTRQESWQSRNRREAAPAAAGVEADERAVSEALSEAGTAGESGVVKAERALLSTLLGQPSWRRRILAEMPPAQWTVELHRDIVRVLNEAMRDEDADPIRAVALMGLLSEEAAALVSGLMVADEAQTMASEAVIRDWIARVASYWAKQTERDILGMVREKLQNGEPVSADERAALQEALRQTGRMSLEPTEVAA